MASSHAESSCNVEQSLPWRNMQAYSVHSASEGEPPIKLSRAVKDITFGSMAGMVAKVFEHPL
jgi:hypothetical protein